MLITERMVMYHLSMGPLGTISVNRKKLCQTGGAGALFSPLQEPYSDSEKPGHKTTFRIVKDFISFEPGLQRRPRDSFFALFCFFLFRKTLQQVVFQEKGKVLGLKQWCFGNCNVNLIIIHINNSDISIYFICIHEKRRREKKKACLIKF